MTARRTVLAGLAAALASPCAWGPAARADGPPAPRPAPRPSGVRSPESVEAIFGRSGLADLTGFALVDLATGATLEAHRPGAAQPPASVAKIVTTLYAREALGPGYRFRTEIRASGPVADGTIAGDMTLAGGGDPAFDTETLAGLVAALGERGVRRAGGRLLVADGALPFVPQIDADQPVSAGYNATIAGMNLDFNRVHLAWGPGADGPALAFSAPLPEGGGVPVAGITARLADGGQPAHAGEDGREVWTLPRASLAGRGTVWLPVRAPGAYAGEVFRGLAAEAGVALPAAEVVAAAPDGPALALHDSPPLDTLLAGMLRYSTNLTAEVVGLRASQSRGVGPRDLGASGAAMTAWAQARFGLGPARFANHSGLTDGSAVSAADLARVVRGGEGLGLAALLRERPILGADRKPVAIGDMRIRAKTGTLNFVSGLAGYLVGGERRLGFAILAADPALRARVRPEERDDPPGGNAWLVRARAQEQALLRRWAEAFG